MRQLPALLGVVVGVLATYLLTTVGERARWRRDQRVRWDTVRMPAYVEYGNAVKRVVHVATRLAATRGLRTRRSRYRWRASTSSPGTTTTGAPATTSAWPAR